MSNSFTNIFTGSPVFPTPLSQQIFSFTGNTSLFWPTQFLDTPNTIAGINYISVNANGYNIALPDATLASVGMGALIINSSGSPHDFNITDFSGGFKANLTAGEAVVFLLKDNTTQAGVWTIVPYAGGITAVTSVAATALTDGITIGGSPITSAGTLTFSLSDSLVSLTDLNTLGFLVQTAPGVLNARTIIGGANIDVTNDDGVAGNAVVDLSDTLVGISSIDVGNFNIANNTIASTSGNINIIPNGTSHILLGQGLTPVTISDTSDVSNVDTLSVTTGATISEVGIAGHIIAAIGGSGNLQVASSGTGSLTLKGTSNTNPLIIDQNNNLFHPAVPKCWVSFVGASGVINSSYNVTSVNRTGAGQYTVTIPGTLFTTRLIPLPNCYGASGFFINVQPTSLTTLTVSVRDNANTLADPTEVTLGIMGV